MEAFGFGSPQAVSTDKTYRAVLGLEGSFTSNVNRNIYSQYGRNEFHQAISNDPVSANLRKAADAVSVGGNVVCRVNADAITTNDHPAYRPLILSGNNLYSTEALDYVIGEGIQDTNSTQHVVAANIGTDLFSITSRPRIAGDRRLISQQPDRRYDRPDFRQSRLLGAQRTGREGAAIGERKVRRDRRAADCRTAFL